MNNPYTDRVQKLSLRATGSIMALSAFGYLVYYDWRIALPLFFTSWGINMINGTYK